MSDYLLHLRELATEAADNPSPEARMNNPDMEQRAAVDAYLSAPPGERLLAYWAARGCKIGGHLVTYNDLRKAIAAAEPLAWKSDDERDGWYAGYAAAEPQQFDAKHAAIIAEMRRKAAGWREPDLAQVEGPNDLKIFGGSIANDLDRWASAFARLEGALAHPQPTADLRAAQINAAARALYKGYEECGDARVAEVFGYKNSPDPEAKAVFGQIVKEMREWAEAALNAALATPSIPANSEGLVEAGRFLLDRLVDHEVRMSSDDDAREWYGHVTPAMARFRAALSTQQAPARAEGVS